jgi:hypothetical protein
MIAAAHFRAGQVNPLDNRDESTLSGDAMTSPRPDLSLTMVDTRRPAMIRTLNGSCHRGTLGAPGLRPKPLRACAPAHCD